MSQRAFADYIGVHYNTIGYYELDKQVPSEQMYPVLSKLFNMNVRDIERMCSNESTNRRSNARESRKNPQNV